LVSTSTVLYDEELPKVFSSSNDLALLKNLGSCTASNGAFALETLTCGLSFNGEIEQSELHLNEASNNHELHTKTTQPSHEHLPPLSTAKCLSNDDQSVLPSADIDYDTFHDDLQDMEENPSTCVWIGGIDDAHSSKLQSVSKNHSTICNSPCNLVEMEHPNLNERYFWNDFQFERKENQHFEDASERTKFASTSSNEDFDNMDVDGENTSKIQNVFKSQQLFSVPLDDRESFPLDSPHASKNHNNIISSQSSNVLLELESLCSQRAIGFETYDLESCVRIHKDEVESMEQVESLKDAFSIQEPCYQGHTLIEELPSLPVDVKNETKVTRSGSEIYEEFCNGRPLEDDIPYVVVEPICVQSPVHQFHKDAYSQKNATQQSMEIYPMQDAIKELANGALLYDDPAIDIIAIKEQSQINTSIINTKSRKQVLKPLFFPGFLKKNPVFTLEKSSNVVDNDPIISEGNVKDHFDENKGLSNDKLTKNLSLNGKENEDKNLNINGKLNNHAISNGNGGSEQLELKRYPKDLLMDFGRENDVPIFMDQSRGLKNLKQGRNDSCACGSQQKWKKCCGKAIILKGGLATKQVKV
jgi:hypothetical protein